MGLDAVMYADAPRSLTAEEVKKLSVHANIALGGLDVLYCDAKRGEHSLTLVRDNDHRVCVHTISRYYGEGFERGPLVGLLMTAKFLRHHLGEGTVVYYGSDAEDELMPLDEEREKSLLNHLFGEAGASYYAQMGREKQDFVCDFCDIPIAFNSFGPGAVKGGYCLSCHRRWSVDAKGVATELENSR